MEQTEESGRGVLARNAVVFQLKLMADGVRDLVLIPVALAAAVVGLVRGGEKPAREFEQVVELGRQSEQWINLFGHHSVPEGSSMGTSIDVVFAKVEEVLKKQYQAEGTSERAQAEINDALQEAHQQARSGESPH